MPMLYTPSDCSKTFSTENTWLVPNVLPSPGHQPGSEFLNEDAVLDRLYQDDPQDSQSTFIYRGQLSRVGRCWPPEVGVETGGRQFQKYELLLESIIPSDYRGFEAQRAGVNGAPSAERYGTLLTHVQQAATYMALCSLKNNLNEPSISEWMTHLRSMYGVDRHTAIGSIAQHYGLQTAYVDWTSSIQVALWFATNDWVSGNHQSGTERVIYRIDLNILTEVENDLNAQFGFSGDNVLRHTDIRYIPPLLALRPSAQQGWSLVGMESPYFLIELINRGGIFAFQFANPSQSQRNIHARQNLAPSDALSNLIGNIDLPDVSEAALIQWVADNIDPVVSSASQNDPGHPQWLRNFIDQYQC